MFQFHSAHLTERTQKSVDEEVSDDEDDRRRRKCVAAAMNETTSKRRQLPKVRRKQRMEDKQVNSTNGWMIQNHLIRVSEM
jgi:hypothetical protein